MSVFEPFLGAVVVFGDEGRSGRAEVLHNSFFVSDLLVIGLALVDLHCDHLGEIDNRLFRGNLIVVSPSFLLE